jgi:hypothetical protein
MDSTPAPVRIWCFTDTEDVERLAALGVDKMIVISTGTTIGEGAAGLAGC